MLYHLLTSLTEHLSFLRVFHYTSFRVLASALTSLTFMLWLFPSVIDQLRLWQHGSSNVREDTPETHQKKVGTPTMGGLFILVCVTLSSLLWADLRNILVWVTLSVMLGFGAIGFVDDYRKIKKRNSKGLAGRRKLFWQLMVLLGATGILYLNARGYLGHTAYGLDSKLSIPFVSVRWLNPDLGWFYLPFAYFVIIGTSNAVNLTDGLDGLAIGPTIVSSATFLILSYAAGLVLTFYSGTAWVDFNVATYLNIPHIHGISELAVVCAAIAGAGIGFLWYNTFPASVFMGDVGSLALGGALGTVAVLSKNEMLSAIVHGVFLMEAISVITQVASFKWRKKRIFRMAPIHHHFELKGWAEPKIIVRFWIISIILALTSLVSLKIR